MKKIIFMGTPEFSATVLKGILSKNKDYEVMAVVTQPDRPVGRKKVLTASPVKQVAQAHGIAVFQPEKLSGSNEMASLLTLDADLIVTAAYGQFVPTKLLKFPKYKAINVHASLLPKFRGGAPIHYAIWQGESETGISIMYMEKEMDAGDILAQASIPIGFTDDVGELFERLAILGRDLLLETLPLLFEEKLNPIKQDVTLATYSPTITKEQEKINWNQTATEVHNHIRAFRPFPSTYTLWENARLKIWQGHPIADAVSDTFEPGTVVIIDNEQIIVQCHNSLYAIEELQPSGKNRMNVATFLNGIDRNKLIGKKFE